MTTPRDFPHRRPSSFLGRFPAAAGAIGLAIGLNAQEIGFTVQGRLNQEGKPASGLFDFHFTLRSSPNGEALGEFLRPGVLVQDGLFATAVPIRQAFFDVFTAAGEEIHEDARFLEIAVARTAEVARAADDSTAGRAHPAAPPPGFVTLQPSIRITATPTAIRAAAAATISPGGITPSSLVGSTLPATLSGLVAIKAGSTFAVVPTPPPAWLLSGNASTTSADFLGTTDSRPLELRVNNTRALSISPSATSPNLVGGHPGNLASGAVGVFIGGGGSAGHNNLASGDYAFLGGGLSNRVEGLAATLSGGQGNSATNSHATISGGFENFAGGAFSAIGGGSRNRAGNLHTTIGGGRQNSADGTAATVSGGQDNVAILDQATVGGGGANLAAGPGATTSGGIGNKAELDLATVSGGGENWARTIGATVGGGVGNQAQAPHSTVGGGNANFATGAYASIPGGAQALASQHGQMAQAAGDFALPGDAQTSTFVLRGVTSPAAPGTTLSLDGLGLPLRVEPGRTRTFEILVAALSAGVPPNFSISAGYSIRGVIRNRAGSTSFVGTPSVTELGEEEPTWSVQVATGPDHLRINVNSAATPDTVRWVARVQTAEVAW